MEDLTEDKLTEIVIDFSGLDGSEEALNEFFGFGGTDYVSFGRNVEIILRRMFGQNKIPVVVRGSQTQVSSFAKALGAEKKYIETAKSLGLTDARTLRNKSKAQSAAKEFKRLTGIEWPFK